MIEYVIVGTFLIVIFAITKYLINQSTNPTLKTVIGWFGLLIFVNIVMTVFIFYSHDSIQVKPGTMGQKGKRGKDGSQGQTGKCVMCSPVQKTLKQKIKSKERIVPSVFIVE